MEGSILTSDSSYFNSPTKLINKDKTQKKSNKLNYEEKVKESKEPNNYFKKRILKEQQEKKNLLINTNNSIIQEHELDHNESKKVNENEISSNTINTKNTPLQKMVVEDNSYILRENNKEKDLTRSKTNNSLFHGNTKHKKNPSTSILNNNNKSNQNQNSNIILDNNNEKWKKLKIGDIISERGLLNGNPNDILMQGQLLRYTLYPQNKTHLYSQCYSSKFCILSRNYFGYYRSKEDFLTIQNPLLHIANSNICSVNRINLEKNKNDTKNKGKHYYYLLLEYYDAEVDSRSNRSII